MSILHSCYGGRLHADVTPSSLAEKVQREIAPLIVILTKKKKIRIERVAQKSSYF